MARPFTTLRKLLAEQDIDQKYLAELLNRSPSYVSSRMAARGPWDLDEQYFLLDLLHIPYRQMCEVFPPKGKEEGLQEKLGPPPAGNLFLQLADAFRAVAEQGGRLER